MIGGQAFRIFHEIAFFEWETGAPADIAYMVDQSHSLKPKIEEMIQTAATAQELYAKAALVDHKRLAPLQSGAELIDAEECLKSAFATDVRPAIREWVQSKGLPVDPMDAFRQSGYLERITQHFDGVYARRPLGKSIVAYDQIGPLADLGKLCHRFIVGFCSDHPTAP